MRIFLELSFFFIIKDNYSILKYGKGGHDMLKAVIFDMDGLMVDSEIISYYCYRDLLKDYGYEFTKADYIRDFPGKPLKTSITYIKEHYHIDYDLEEKINQFHQRESQYMKKEGVKLKTGLVELLQYLKEHHYKTIVATSSFKERAYSILEGHHILDYFDDTVFSSEVKCGKPNPDIFLKACEKLNINVDEALVLEDSEAGIQAAYEAHIPVICVPDMKFPSEEYIQKTSQVLSSLHDVLDFIKSI